MSENRKEKGKRGETLAAQFLKKKGMTLLESNWRAGRNEIDLILREEQTLIFVEVKTRSKKYFGSPGTFLSKAQEQRIAQAAFHYCAEVGHDWEVRYDLVEVLLQGDSHQITYYKDAFYPGDSGW
ncbi:MAG: YraN family protein [Bacteroidetes bacterium]|nr:YraN family protein [Bacteroidota bacterium]